MIALPSPDLDRFGKLLALLASDQLGERASAAAKATEFLSTRRLGWHDVIASLKRPPVVIASRPAPRTPAAYRDHQRSARFCLLSPVTWNQRERDFLTQMQAQSRSVSEKQSAWLQALVDRARAAGGAQ